MSNGPELTEIQSKWRQQMVLSELTHEHLLLRTAAKFGAIDATNIHNYPLSRYR